MSEVKRLPRHLLQVSKDRAKTFCKAEDVAKLEESHAELVMILRAWWRGSTSPKTLGSMVEAALANAKEVGE